MPDRPKLFIYTGASDPTGALIAAHRQAVLLQRQAEITLVLSSKSRMTADQFPGVASVLYLPLAQPRRKLGAILRYPFALLRAGWRLRKELQAADCQRLQVNDIYFLEGAIARLFGYRGQIVTWVRIEPLRLGRIMSGLSGLAAKAFSTKVVAVSSYIQKLLPASLDAIVLHDPAFPSSTNKSMKPGARFVFVGNYSRGKGQDLAIEAFSKICEQFENMTLEMYGSDLGLVENRVYVEDLKKRAASSPAPDRVAIHGFVEDTSEVLSGALAALVLSNSESFSLTCQEASANGVAVIATDCGGPAEIIDDGVSGFLVPVGDSEAVSRRMRQLLEDTEKARQMGLAGAALVRKRFAPEPFVAALVDIFELQRNDAMSKADRRRQRGPVHPS